jgi:hypothetical protein
VRHDANVKIAMDGRCCWIDNRMIERLWQSLKYECVYLNALLLAGPAPAQSRRRVQQWQIRQSSRQQRLDLD